MEMTACPLCHAKSETVLATKLRRGEGRVLYCKPCFLGFLDAPLVDAEAYYREQYRREVSNSPEGGAMGAREIFDAYRRYQGERLNLVLPRVSRDTSVLEIGASAGQFLSHLRHETKHLHATELSKECCDFLMDELSIPADNELLPNSRYWNEQFDIVCAFQVMEHVDDPVKFLDEVSHVLKPGGTAFIEVPNLGDALMSVWQLDAYRDFYYHAQHRLYFTASSLHVAAGMAGFHRRKILPVQDYNLLNHLHWIMNRFPQPTGDIGLGEVKLSGSEHSEIPDWLSGEMRSLHERYVEKLKENNVTSNLMLILTKGE